MLEQIATPSQPVLVLLDNVQHAPPAIHKLLRRWHAIAKTQEQYLSIVTANQSDNTCSIGEDVRCDTIHLSGMSNEKLRLLLESMGGRIPNEAIEVVETLSEGNPYIAISLLRGIVEACAMVGVEDGWKIDTNRLASLHASQEVSNIILQRLQMLPADCRNCLSIGALIGKEFDLGTLSNLLQIPREQLQQVLQTAVDRGFISTQPDSEVCSFSHEELRQRATSLWPRGIDLHFICSIADYWASHAPHRAGEIAEHYSLAATQIKRLTMHSQQPNARVRNIRLKTLKRCIKSRPKM